MAEFAFLYPAWLWALIPLLLLLPWLKNAFRKTKLIAPHLAVLFTGEEQNTKNNILIFLGIAWFIAVLSLAAPSFKKQALPAFTLSGARILVMDMSLSLYAKDIEPNRLQQAKYKALDMLPSWGEGSTGLVTYAADSYIVSPLTEDANTLKNLIPELSPDIMPIAGSNAVAGVKQAIDLLSQANFATGDIIIISDEITSQQAKEILKLTFNKSYRISILAVATEQGAPIPLKGGQLLVSDGKTVIAKLDLEPMATITQATGGVLERWQPTNLDVSAIVALTQVPISSDATAQNQSVSERVNQGFWLLLPLLVLALIGFRRGVILSAALFLFPVQESYADAFKTDNQLGLNHYKSGDYQQAAESFTSKKWKAVAQYQAGNYQAAIENLASETDSVSRYNLGNAYAQTGEYQKALNIYQSLLDENPDHQDAKYNAEIVKKALEQQQQQQQQKNNNEKDNQGNNEQNDHSSQNNPSESNENKQTDNSQAQNNQAPNNPAPSNQAQENDENNNQNAEQENQQNSQQNLSEKNKNENAQQMKNENNLNDKSEENSSESATEEVSGLTKSNPTLKKLEQVNDDTAALIRAQLLLQAREKKAQPQSSKAW